MHGAVKRAYPAPSRCSRNFIKDDEDFAWARGAVHELLAHGAVSRWTDLRDELLAGGFPAPERPHLVMPLIVADKPSSAPSDRKRRLIHDCRLLNEHLESWAFKLDQLRDFAKCLRPGDRLVTVDIASAYHHVDIALRHRTLLGFNLDGVDYVYCVLPFGLSVAAFTFCKFSAVVADMLRSSGLCEALLVYMDDFCASVGAAPDAPRARAIVQAIEDFGFLVNWSKTDLTTPTRATSLGFIIDTILMAYDVPPKRLEKLTALARLVLESPGGVRAKTLASLCGQVWSMQTALGLVCRLRSRYLTLCLLPAARRQHYGMLVRVEGRAREELQLWARRVHALPRMPLHTHLRRPDVVLECDASASALASIVLLVPSELSGLEGMRIHRLLDARERRGSSCLREMLGYAHAVRTFASRHQGRLGGFVVEIVGDSKAASYVFANGGSQAADAESGELLILEALLDILGVAEAEGFEVVFRWVPRELLADTDALSKWEDRMDFSLSAAAFDHVVRTYGPFDIDRFASPHNRKCPAFNSKFDSVGSAGVDALAQNWSSGTSYVLADFHKLDKVLDIVERDDASAVIIVPEWPRYPFWIRVRSAAWQRRVVASEFLGAEALVPNPENAASCFFGERFNSRLLVMRVEPVGAGADDGAAASSGGDPAPGIAPASTAATASARAEPRGRGRRAGRSAQRSRAPSSPIASSV